MMSTNTGTHVCLFPCLQDALSGVNHKTDFAGHSTTLKQLTYLVSDHLEILKLLHVNFKVLTISTELPLV